MYSNLRNIQILVSLLKKYNVRNIVISAGTRHTPFVYSVEHDSFFHTYSIVDERSAGFFAIGLIEELHEPAAVVCTSGTALQIMFQLQMKHFINSYHCFYLRQIAIITTCFNKRNK